MHWFQKVLYVNLILTSLLLCCANGQGPLADAGKKLITPIQDNIKKLIDANRRDMVSLLERIGMKPDQLMKNVFPGIAKFNITQLKYCYDMSMDGEEYNFFENTFMGTVQKYYNHFTDNWDVKKFPAKIKSLYDSMTNIYTHALECATNNSNYQLGFTQLSDYSDDEYRTLLGERPSDRMYDEYERRPASDSQQNDDDGYQQNQSNNNNNNNDRNHNNNRDRNNNNNNNNRRGQNQSPINLNTDKTISVPTNNDRNPQSDFHDDRNPNYDNNRRGGQNNHNNRPNNDRFNEEDRDRNPPRRGENDRDDNRNRGNPNRGGNDRDDNRNRGNPNRVESNRDDNRNRNQQENNRNFDSAERNRNQNRNQNRLTEDRDSQRRGDNNRNDFINQNERRQDDRRIVNNNNNFDSGNILRQPSSNPDINRGQLPRRDENLGFNNERNFGNNQGLNNQGSGLGRFKRANNGVPKKCKPKRLEPLPKKWNWRARGKVTPAKYQGSCGSCWTFTALAALESALIIKDPKFDSNIDLSEQELLSCARSKGCSGGTAVDAYNYMLKDNKGITDESTWPYDQKEDNCNDRKRGRKVARIKDYCLRGKYVKVNGQPEQLDDEEIMYIVKEFGPVYTTINADDLGMKNLKNGIYKYKKCPKETNHAVTIVGWDQESWIIKNSWGKKWGDEGFFRMKRGQNLCGINTYIMFPLV